MISPLTRTLIGNKRLCEAFKAPTLRATIEKVKVDPSHKYRFYDGGKLFYPTYPHYEHRLTPDPNTVYEVHYVRDRLKIHEGNSPQELTIEHIYDVRGVAVEWFNAQAERTKHLVFHDPNETDGGSAFFFIENFYLEQGERVRVHFNYE